MVEFGVLGAFAIMLVVTMGMGMPLWGSLALGLLLFMGYGIYRGHTLRELGRMGLSGVKTIGGVLSLLVIIGMITATWRAAGTIPAIVCLSTRLISPRLYLLVAFLLCSGMSMLMGTSFGASATMGVICMTIARAMGVNPALAGGAILAGAYCGDRCSPMSSSASVVATITGSDLFDNVNRMIRTGAVPFAASCVLYAVVGSLTAGSGMVPDVAQAFVRVFDLSPVVLLPAVVVVILSCLKVDVHKTMLVSLALALAICVGVQGIPVRDLPALLWGGFRVADPELSHMVDGGGIVTMVEIVVIIAIAASYAGLFEGTGLIRGMRGVVNGVSRRYTPFVGVLATSVFTSIISCEQTLAVMLTQQLCGEVEGNGSALALDLENSVVVVSALAPWSIGCAAILSFVSAPAASVLWAFLLYLIPAWTLVLSWHERRDPAFVDSAAGHFFGLAAHDDARRFHPAEA